MRKEITDYDILTAKYLDNNATDEEQMQLCNWVKQAKDNETLFLQTAKAWEKSTIELQDETIIQKYADKFEQIRVKKRRNLHRWVISTAAAVILIFLTMQFFVPNFILNEKMLTVVAQDTKKEILLPDSSVVWLNARSTLKYPAKFKRERNVFLTGEAYFDVKKDAGKAFSVSTKNITIEVLGTKFLVTDYQRAATTETVLESGKINLRINASDKKIEMKPNQQVIYDRENGNTSVQTVNASDYTSWHKKSLLFENIRLADVFIQLEKWYGIQINCKNNRLLNTPVSFTLDDESMDEILSILQQVTSFTWKKNTDNHIIIE